MGFCRPLPGAVRGWETWRSCSCSGRTFCRKRLDLSEFSYEASPFADWAVPPMPDRSALWGADNLHLIVEYQHSERSREWNVLPERFEAQAELFRGVEAMNGLEALLEESERWGRRAR